MKSQIKKDLLAKNIHHVTLEIDYPTENYPENDCP